MVAAAAPLTLLIAAYYVPETPSYLSMCGRDDEAAVSLQWLRGEETDVSVEWNAIQANVRRQQQQHHHHHQLNQHHQHHHQHQHRQHQPVARSSRSPGRPRSGDRGAGWPLDRRFVRPLLTTCGVMMVRHSPIVSITILIGDFVSVRTKKMGDMNEFRDSRTGNHSSDAVPS